MASHFFPVNDIKDFVMSRWSTLSSVSFDEAVLATLNQKPSHRGLHGRINSTLMEHLPS